EIHPGDHMVRSWYTDPAISERTEIAGATRYALGTNIHVSYDFMIEPGAANNSQYFMVLGQLHQTQPGSPGTGSPPFAFGMAGEHMNIIINQAGSYRTIWEDPNPITRGKWYHFDLNIRFDPTGGGHLDYERDGVQMVNYNGALGWVGMGDEYWKEGI